MPLPLWWYLLIFRGKSNAKRRSILHYEQTNIWWYMHRVYLKGTFSFLPWVSVVYNNVIMYLMYHFCEQQGINLCFLTLNMKLSHANSSIPRALLLLRQLTRYAVSIIIIWRVPLKSSRYRSFWNISTRVQYEIGCIVQMQNI